MSAVDVSVAIIPLNDLGPTVCPSTNRPPCRPGVATSRIIGSSGSGTASLYASASGVRLRILCRERCDGERKNQQSLHLT